MLNKSKSIYPIPKDWERDEDRKKFAVRLDEIVRELYSRVKNNLTTASPGFVLDARQGKALKDAMDANTSANLSQQTNKITNNYSKAIRIGSLVIVTVSASVTSAIATGGTLYTVPADYRPADTVNAVFAYLNSGTNIRYRPDYFSITSAGVLSQSWSSSWAAGEFHAVFMYHVK